MAWKAAVSLPVLCYKDEAASLSKGISLYKVASIAKNEKES